MQMRAAGSTVSAVAHELSDSKELLFARRLVEVAIENTHHLALHATTHGDSEAAGMFVGPIDPFHRFASAHGEERCAIRDRVIARRAMARIRRAACSVPAPCWYR